METTTFPRVTEYGDAIVSGHMSAQTVLALGTGRFGRLWALKHHTAGYECAGSRARWTDEIWSVTTVSDGVTYGVRFRDKAGALDRYDEVRKLKGGAA